MLLLMAHSAALLLHKIPLIAESVDLLLLMLLLFRALLAGVINPRGGRAVPPALRASITLRWQWLTLTSI